MYDFDWIGWFHAAFGFIALALGLLVVLRRKGTRGHRRTGRIYVAAMLLLNGTALAIYDLFGFFGPFHVAAVVSLCTLAAGLHPMYARRRGERHFERHAMFMSWSYAGLLAAATAELAVRLPGAEFASAVLASTVLVVAGAAFIIHTRVPRILTALGLSGRARSRGTTVRHPEETDMDPQPNTDDLAAMRRLMEESSRGVYETGKHYMLWGLVVAAGLCLTYWSLGRREAWIPWIWGIGLLVGWGAAAWLGSREAARAPVETLVSQTRAGIWIGCGIGMTILGLLGYYTGAIRPGALPAVIAVVMGVGYFASSFAYRSMVVRALGVAWWIGAVALLLWQGPHALLVLAALLVVLQVVPGALFHRRARARAASAAVTA